MADESTRKDSNGVNFTSNTRRDPIPTSAPVKIHDGSGVAKDGWMNGGTVVKTSKN
jgi:hypothetical protein